MNWPGRKQMWLKIFLWCCPWIPAVPRCRTEVRMTYDEKNLYMIAVYHHGPLPGPYMVESLRRDLNFGKNDNFLFFMDPFDDQTNGFSFGANAAGAQWDGIMYEGSKVDLSWDNKWVSAVKNYEDKWVFEVAIPFKTIRYKKGITNWGINFSRLDLKTTEKSAGRRCPGNFRAPLWLIPAPWSGISRHRHAGTNISVNSLCTGGLSREYRDQISPQNTGKKWASMLKLPLPPL